MSVTFLTYSSRSGSTYFARQLAERFDVVVVPEFQFPYRVITLPPETLLSEKRARTLLQEDRQLDWVDLERIGPGERTVSDLITTVLDQYAVSRTGQPGEHYLVKLGGMHRLWPNVKAHFPQARGIAVVRDGRAVVNSLLNSPSPYLEGVSMGYGDAWWSAKRWGADVRTQLALADADPSFSVVRYADLIDDVEAVTAATGAQQGWQATPGGVASFGVRPEESAIHARIGGPADGHRVEAWASELSRDTRILVESLCADELASVGAPAPLDVPPPAKLASVARGALRHGATQARLSVRRLSNIRSPQEAMDRMRRVRAVRG